MMSQPMRPKRATREKRMSRQEPMQNGMKMSPAVKSTPASTPKATTSLIKPLVQMPSTKPSDTPMAQAKMKMNLPVAGIAPLPKTPAIVSRPVRAQSKQKMSKRPKTGTK